LNLTKFYNIQEYLLKIRKHSSNISNISDLHKREDEILVNSYYDESIKNSFNNQEILAESNFNLGYFYYYRDEFEKATSLLKKAIFHKPLRLQYLRYYLMSRYLSKLIMIIRKYKLNRLLDPLRYLDKNNIFFRNKF
jgi:hypothetical protein